MSYLPFLLQRLRTFFAPWLIDPEVPAHHGWFSYEDVPLKWQCPFGLLFDLLSGNEPATFEDTHEAQEGSPRRAQSSAQSVIPWRLVLHFKDWPSEQLIPLDAELKPLHDTYINSVKEADYLRNGTAKAIMSLSMDDSTKLWNGVKDHDSTAFHAINRKLLSPASGDTHRHVPLKLYLPRAAEPNSAAEQPHGVLRVIQAPVAPMTSTKDPQTLGKALHCLLPTVFPSRRSYIHAQAILHGAVVPPGALLQELSYNAAYCDGFLHIAIKVVNIG